MHEFSLTNIVNNSILRLCNSYGWNKVSKILVRVGGIRRFNPELMAYIFGIVSRGTLTDGAEFAVMSVPVTMRCKDCGHKIIRDDVESVCPVCGSKNLEVTSGLELSIESLEVEKY